MNVTSGGWIASIQSTIYLDYENVLFVTPLTINISYRFVYVEKVFLLTDTADENQMTSDVNVSKVTLSTVM